MCLQVQRDALPLEQGQQLLQRAPEHAVRLTVQRAEDPEPEPREAELEAKRVVRGTSGPPPA